MKDIILKIILLIEICLLEYAMLAAMVFILSVIFHFEFSFLYTGFIWLTLQIMQIIQRHNRKKQ